MYTRQRRKIVAKKDKTIIVHVTKKHQALNSLGYSDVAVGFTIVKFPCTNRIVDLPAKANKFIADFDKCREPKQPAIFKPFSFKLRIPSGVAV
jgi:hypothetical protein